MKQVFIDLLNKLKELNRFQVIFVYNKQIDRARAGIIKFNTPACFVQIIQGKINNLGSKLQGSDLDIRFHIVDGQIDAADGTYDQNLEVFDLRNQIRKTFIGYQPTGCGPISTDDEMQEYNHTILYHMVLKYKCHFIDNSAYDEIILEPYYIIWNINDLEYDITDGIWDKLIMPSLELQLNNI